MAAIAHIPFRALKAGAVALAASALLLSCGANRAQVAAAGAGNPIAVSSELPTELNLAGGGAQNATLDQAAAFAWQEFIALNWPARIQTGAGGDRDSPAGDCLFGDPNPACSSRPLTWQTFRGKAEIFTAAGSAQPYDALPDYSGVYTSPPPPAQPMQPPVPCSDFTPGAQSAWVNLDESTEIGLAAMYAGIVTASPSPDNNAPQLIRFMAKANRAEFDYVNAIGAASAIPSGLVAATQAFVLANGSPPAGATNLVSLPNNTIELKAGWRQLDPQEDASRFHTALVRHYEPLASGNGQCFREDVWGLVSLHIIQKTASAPHFIFATFEQADNIRTLQGPPLEDVDGNIVGGPPCGTGQQPPCRTPSVQYQDSDTLGNPPSGPPNVTATGPYCTPNIATLPANRLYYLNSIMEGTAVPTGGFICVNGRDHAIPPEIINANQNAHSAIAGYNQANGIQNSPWMYYKLINVQYMPMTLPPPGPNPPATLPPYSGPNVATFYQANSVVESNYTLQNFSGHLNFNSGTKSDWTSQDSPPGPVGQPAYNMYYLQQGKTAATPYNMGGCMGCHGNAQRAGSDFSFILGGGTVFVPESIPVLSPQGARVDLARALVKWRQSPKR